MSIPYLRERGNPSSSQQQYYGSHNFDSNDNQIFDSRSSSNSGHGFRSSPAAGSSSNYQGRASPYPQYGSAAAAGLMDMADIDKSEAVKKNKTLRPIIRLLSNMGSCIAPSIKDENDETNFPVSVQSTASSAGFSQSSGLSIYSMDGSLPTNSAAIVFTMSELIKATQNFASSHKIGQGGSGTVYKGKLRDGRIVAIKRSKKHSYEEELTAEFRNELSTLSNIDHLNLVKFIGYLDNASERILVVEYVSNGNLRQHLNGQLGSVLDFATRLDIAIDVAHAITYLHMYAERPIIHRDIKSSNILISENFRAKVADFGFSRLAPWEMEATHVSTQVKGTAGYLDPEYLKTYKLSTKSDVYSFGIVLIELITGRLPIEVKRPMLERITAKWAFQMLNEGRMMEVVDPKMERSRVVIEMAERMLVVGFSCAAPSKRERPSMRKAAELLWNIRKDYKTKIQPSSSSSSSSV